MLLLIQNFHERSIIESQDRQNFDSTCMLVLQLCTPITTKMHSISANQMYITFSSILLKLLMRLRQIPGPIDKS